MSGGLLHGRPLVALDPSRDGSQELYASDLIDKPTFDGRSFEHCTFANVSFLDAKIKDCRFLNCAFMDCYFRRTVFTSSTFTGCKFEDCTLNELQFVDCTFKFPIFRGCFIKYDEFQHELGNDPGMRYRIADELAREAAAGGAGKDAREYRLEAATAWEDHLKNIALASDSEYYRTHFDTRARLVAIPAWVRQKLNRFLWGYGERGWVLGRSFAIVGFVLYPVLFWVLARDSLERASSGTQRPRPARFWDYELFSLDNLLNRPGFSEIGFTGTFARFLVATEVLVGLLFIGLFISVVFNWMRRR